MWIRGYKEEIQTMSPSRQIDTVNRTTTGSAATIISRSFAVETRLRRDTSCVWRHFIGEDFCAASMNTRERGEKKGKKEKKEKRRAPRLKKIHRKDIRETQKTRRGLSSIIRPEKAPRAFSSFCARPPPLLLPGPPPPSQRQATSSRAHRKFYYSILINGMTRAASYRQPDI